MKSWIVVVFLAAPLLLVAREAPLPAPDTPTSIEPCAEAISYAKAHRFAIDGIGRIEHAEQGGRLGDSLTMLATLRSGTLQQQWLIELVIGATSDHENAEHPSRSIAITSPTSGRTFHFVTGPGLPIEIRTAGPFTIGKNAEAIEKYGRIYMGPALLMLGLDKSCRTALRQADEQLKGSRSINSSPAEVMFTEAEEQEAYGALYALQEFLSGVLGSPEVAVILWNIAEKPSTWSIVSHGGAIVGGIANDGDPAVLDSSKWELGALPVYRLPIAVSFNGKPAMRCALVVTAPVRPLFACAGIVGLVAEPASTANKRLEIRVVSAHERSP